MSPRVLGRVTHQIGVLRRAPRGDRFQELNRRRSEEGRNGGARRTFAITVGALLVILGLLTYPIPGPPSNLMILVGLALIAQELIWVARALDGLEVRAHGRHRKNVAAWRRLTDRMKGFIGFLCTLFLAACAGGLYLLLSAG